MYILIFYRNLKLQTKYSATIYIIIKSYFILNIIWTVYKPKHWKYIIILVYKCNNDVVFKKIINSLFNFSIGYLINTGFN